MLQPFITWNAIIVMIRNTETGNFDFFHILMGMRLVHFISKDNN
jgi:hypothetical protein